MKDNLILKLKKFDISRKVISALLGVNESTVGRWETGQSSPSNAEEQLLTCLLTLAEKASSNKEARMSLDGILGSAAGKPTGTSWMNKYGALLGAAGLLVVLAFAVSETIKRKN